MKAGRIVGGPLAGCAGELRRVTTTGTHVVELTEPKGGYGIGDVVHVGPGEWEPARDSGMTVEDLRTLIRDIPGDVSVLVLLHGRSLTVNECRVSSGSDGKRRTLVLDLVGRP